VLTAGGRLVGIVEEEEEASLPPYAARYMAELGWIAASSTATIPGFFPPPEFDVALAVFNKFEFGGAFKRLCIGAGRAAGFLSSIPLPMTVGGGVRFGLPRRL
jgi:hypothetical protein